MHTLYIPELFAFQQTLRQLSSQQLSQLPVLKLPVLQGWLSRGRLSHQACSHAFPFKDFSLEVSDEVSPPYAALALQAEADFDGRLDNNTCFRMDPVYLQPDRDSAVMLAHEQLALTEKEAMELVDTINRHFSDEPWQLYMAAPHRWYLFSNTHTRIDTSPVYQALGQDVRPFLPRGEDEIYWRKISNEIQMLLHSHTVNQQRESQHQPPVNATWLWGGGVLPEIKTKPLPDVLATTDPVFRGLGYYLGINVVEPGEGMAAMKKDNTVFIVLDTLLEAARENDLYRFITILNQMEQDYFQAVESLLQKGMIDALKIMDNTGTEIIINKKTLLQHFKRPSSFTRFKNA